MGRLTFSNFLKDGAGRESMTALLLFLSFWPATYAMLTRNSEEIFYAYIAAFTGLAINKQWAGRNAVDVNQLETTRNSDTISASITTDTVVAKRRTRTTKGKRRPF